MSRTCVYYDWIVNSSLSFYPITSQHEFYNRKTQLCQVRTQRCCVFLPMKLQKITVQEHIFGGLARPLPLVCSTPQPTLSPSPTTCTVDDFQRLIFGNRQSLKKFTEKTKIVGHPKS